MASEYRSLFDAAAQELSFAKRATAFAAAGTRLRKELEPEATAKVLESLPREDTFAALGVLAMAQKANDPSIPKALVNHPSQAVRFKAATMLHAADAEEALLSDESSKQLKQWLVRDCASLPCNRRTLEHVERLFDHETVWLVLARTRDAALFKEWTERLKHLWPSSGLPGLAKVAKTFPDEILQLLRKGQFSRASSDWLLPVAQKRPKQVLELVCGLQASGPLAQHRRLQEPVQKRLIEWGWRHQHEVMLQICVSINAGSAAATTGVKDAHELLTLQRGIVSSHHCPTVKCKISTILQVFKAFPESKKTTEEAKRYVELFPADIPHSSEKDLQHLVDACWQLLGELGRRRLDEVVSKKAFASFAGLLPPPLAVEQFFRVLQDVEPDQDAYRFMQSDICRTKNGKYDTHMQQVFERFLQSADAKRGRSAGGQRRGPIECAEQLKTLLKDAVSMDVVQASFDALTARLGGATERTLLRDVVDRMQELDKKLTAEATKKPGKDKSDEEKLPRPSLPLPSHWLHFLPHPKDAPPYVAFLHGLLATWAKEPSVLEANVKFFGTALFWSTISHVLRHALGGQDVYWANPNVENWGRHQKAFAGLGKVALAVQPVPRPEVVAGSVTGGDAKPAEVTKPQAAYFVDLAQKKQDTYGRDSDNRLRGYNILIRDAAQALNPDEGGTVDITVLDDLMPFLVQRLGGEQENIQFSVCRELLRQIPTRVWLTKLEELRGLWKVWSKARGSGEQDSWTATGKELVRLQLMMWEDGQEAPTDACQFGVEITSGTLDFQELLVKYHDPATVPEQRPQALRWLVQSAVPLPKQSAGVTGTLAAGEVQMRVARGGSSRALGRGRSSGGGYSRGRGRSRGGRGQDLFSGSDDEGQSEESWRSSDHQAAADRSRRREDGQQIPLESFCALLQTWAGAARLNERELWAKHSWIGEWWAAHLECNHTLMSAEFILAGAVSHWVRRQPHVAEKVERGEKKAKAKGAKKKLKFWFEPLECEAYKNAVSRIVLQISTSEIPVVEGAKMLAQRCNAVLSKDMLVKDIQDCRSDHAWETLQSGNWYEWAVPGIDRSQPETSLTVELETFSELVGAKEVPRIVQWTALEATKGLSGPVSDGILEKVIAGLDAKMEGMACCVARHFPYVNAALIASGEQDQSGNCDLLTPVLEFWLHAPGTRNARVEQLMKRADAEFLLFFGNSFAEHLATIRQDLLYECLLKLQLPPAPGDVGEFYHHTWKIPSLVRLAQFGKGWRFITEVHNPSKTDSRCIATSRWHPLLQAEFLKKALTTTEMSTLAIIPGLQYVPGVARAGELLEEHPRKQEGTPDTSGWTVVQPSGTLPSGPWPEVEKRFLELGVPSSKNSIGDREADQLLVALGRADHADAALKILGRYASKFKRAKEALVQAVPNLSPSHARRVIEEVCFAPEAGVSLQVASLRLIMDLQVPKPLKLYRVAWRDGNCHRDVAANVLSKVATSAMTDWAPEEVQDMFDLFTGKLSSEEVALKVPTGKAYPEGTYQAMNARRPENLSYVANIVLRALTQTPSWSLPFLPEVVGKLALVSGSTGEAVRALKASSGQATEVLRAFTFISRHARLAAALSVKTGKKPKEGGAESDQVLLKDLAKEAADPTLGRSIAEHVRGKMRLGECSPEAIREFVDEVFLWHSAQPRGDDEQRKRRNASLEDGDRRESRSNRRVRHCGRREERKRKSVSPSSSSDLKGRKRRRMLADRDAAVKAAIQIWVKVLRKDNLAGWDEYLKDMQRQVCARGGAHGLTLLVKSVMGHIPSLQFRAVADGGNESTGVVPTLRAFLERVVAYLETLTGPLDSSEPVEPHAKDAVAAWMEVVVTHWAMMVAQGSTSEEAKILLDRCPKDKGTKMVSNIVSAAATPSWWASLGNQGRDAACEVAQQALWWLQKTNEIECLPIFARWWPIALPSTKAAETLAQVLDFIGKQPAAPTWGLELATTLFKERVSPSAPKTHADPKLARDLLRQALRWLGGIAAEDAVHLWVEMLNYTSGHVLSDDRPIVEDVKELLLSCTTSGVEPPDLPTKACVAPGVLELLAASALPVARLMAVQALQDFDLRGKDQHYVPLLLLAKLRTDECQVVRSGALVVWSSMFVGDADAAAAAEAAAAAGGRAVCAAS